MDRATLSFLQTATPLQREQWDQLQNLLGSMPETGYCPKHGLVTRLDRLRSYREFREHGRIAAPYLCLGCHAEEAR